MPITHTDAAPRHPRARPAVPRRVGLALLAVLAAWGVLGPPAEAAQPCHVPGDFATIQDAVNEPSCATINVAAGIYQGQVFINRPVTIRGEGQDRTVIDAGGATPFPVVSVGSGTVTIKGVTIQGGDNPCCLGLGGGIANGGTLILQNSTVTANESHIGGGIANFSGGTLILQNSTVTGNTTTGEGDDILNAGTLTLTRGTIGECVGVDPGTGCP